MNVSPSADWRTRYGLPAPDGRPLYAYRLDSEAFALLQRDLTARVARGHIQVFSRNAALFVLWAAEWFRRCHRGGIQRWHDVGRPIGLSLDQAEWRELADAGLRQWKIAPLRINGVHHRLAAIAQHGGFPVAALDGGATGWAAQYLEKLVGVLLNEATPTFELADAYATSIESIVPETWSNEHMRVVCAELALKIIELRREAEKGGALAGSLASAWLDQHRAGWRDELPLVIDSDAGRALIDGLIKVAALRGGGSAIGVKRVLAFDENGTRHERVRLSLDGALKDAEGRAVLRNLTGDWSRLRLYASGAFAHYVSGELAVADPDNDGDWFARASITRTEFNIPFALPIEAELRGEGQRVCGPFLMPNGERLGDGLRVCLSDHGAEDEPTHLTVIGTASGAYRAEPVYVDLPGNWTIGAHDEGAECGRVRPDMVCDRTLWKVTGSALATSDRGDLYLVRTGQSGDRRDAMTVRGNAPSRCALANAAVPLFCGSPRIEFSDGGRRRAPLSGEAWWRREGERDWRPYAGKCALGSCEFAWRDTTTRHMRAREEAVILPPDFAIDRSLVGDTLTVIISNWPGEIAFSGGDRAGPASARFPTRNSNLRQCEVSLREAGREPVVLLVPLPHQAWISHWTEGPTPRNRILSLSTIHRFVATANGRCGLMADVLDRHGRPLKQGNATWKFEDELPLSSVRDEIAALLRPLGDIRARVKLDFDDPQPDCWFVTEFAHTLTKEGRGWICDPACAEDNVRFVGRALHDPAIEEDFGAYGLLECAAGPFELRLLHGNWLVYLRLDDHVLTKPQLIAGRDLVVPPHTPLGRAMANGDERERDLALANLCQAVLADPSNDESRAILRSIVDLAVSLHGLPPGTFDIFRKIASEPQLGPFLLFNAAEHEIESIVRLAEGLPFAWSTIPKSYWDEAGRVQCDYLSRAIPDLRREVVRAVVGKLQKIVGFEPALGPLLGQTNCVTPLDQAAQGFMNRRAQDIIGSSSPFRPEYDAELPRWVFNSGYWRALDAPIAAALAARERITLDAEQIYCVKDIARRHPRYFREAFAAKFRENPVG